MSELLELLDPKRLIETALALGVIAGYVGLFFIIFAESGLFFGFFLPGDSLLFTAGILASQGKLDVWLLIPLLAVAAISGDQVGYSFGYRLGRPLFSREDSLLFRRKHLLKAEAFFEKHGGKAIVLARFLPAVRTFTPIVAGVARMPYRRFVSFNIFGGLFWVAGLTLGGYLFGLHVPDVDRYLLPVIAAFVIIPGLPTAIHLWRESRHDLWRLVRSPIARLRARGASPKVPAPRPTPAGQESQAPGVKVESR